MKITSNSVDASLLYWLTSILAYSAFISVMPSHAATPEVDSVKLAAAVQIINKTKPGSDAHMQAAYDYCRIAIGPTGMPVWVNGEIKCRNLIDEAKK